MSPISGGMTNFSIKAREALPEEMRLLLRDYPRDSWPDHPNFAASIQNWMGAHQMFRQLGDIATGNCELYLDKTRSDEEFAGRISYYGNLLVRNLHGHHTWEDRSFFPELGAADDRFEDGLQMLESDHVEMDALLDDFTRGANRVIKLIDLDDPAQAYEETGKLHDTAQDIQRFLTRHLTDEEDLVVPILLHHKLRG